MKEQLILTFANQLGSPGQSLLRLEPQGYGAAWVDLEAVRAAVGIHFNGLCGAVAWANRLAVCTQSIPAFLVIFDTLSWTPVVIEKLEGVADPHGLVYGGERLFLASTGTNQVFAVHIQGDRVARLEPIWSYPGTDSSRDLVHLNGLSLCEGQLLATAFGPRDEWGTWHDSKGRLFSVSTGEVIDEGLVHPHTPVFHQGRLYVCESSPGRVILYGRGSGGSWVRENVVSVGGYARGLWPEGEYLLVAISSQRQVSRSQRIRVQGGEPGSARVMRLDPENGRLEALADLGPFGREVYELLAIPGRVESWGIESAVIERADSLHQSVETLTDYATRVHRDLELLRPNAEQPLVSVVTPAYNMADFLAETIDSVLGQDYPRIELIVLDDGSKDDTPAVLGGYRGRLTAVRHDNMGENRTVNRGLEMARGEILCVVNSDDPLLPGAVSAAVDYLKEHPDVLAAYPDWVEIDAQGKTLATFELPDYDIRSMLLNFNVAMGPGVFIRRRALELIGMRDASLRYTGDLDYWFRLALRGRLSHIPQALATHRTHERAASSAAKGRIMAREVSDLIVRSFASPYLPRELLRHRHRIHSLAHSVAVAYCGRSFSARWKHRLLGLSHALRSGDPQAWSCWTPHTLRRAKALAAGAHRRLIRPLAHSLGKSTAPVWRRPAHLARLSPP
ncbi:MAG: glycosyltransferase, partial [Anaerolineae bacterium]